MKTSIGSFWLPGLLALGLSACNGAGSADSSASASDESNVEPLSVMLTVEEQGKLGVGVAPLVAATFEAAVEGPARVIDGQTIVGAMAELAGTEAATRASSAALARARDLFKVDTAVSAETLESAQRQAATDAAQLDVARAKARLTFGVAAPWLDPARRDTLLAALGAGKAVVLTASFPSGLNTASLQGLAVRRLGGGAGGPVWRAAEAWLGPADPAVPGPTVLAWVTDSPLVAGERLVASIGSGERLSGVVIPASALVLAGGEPWCYVRASDEAFERRRVDLERPSGEGYFQASGFKAGENVVTAGAGLLLAHESGGGGEED